MKKTEMIEALGSALGLEDKRVIAFATLAPLMDRTTAIKLFWTLMELPLEKEEED